MATEKPARWKIVLGYSAFTALALVLCFLLTFPYSALRARAATEALRAGYALRIGSLRPGLVGLTARDVRLSVPPGALSPETVAALTSGDAEAARLLAPAELGEPILIDSVFARPTLFPPGVAFHAQVMGGTVSGSVGGRSERRVKVRLSGLDPSQGNLKNFTGLDMEGRLNGSLDLRLPAGVGTGGRPGEPDLAQADGELALDGQALQLKGSVPGVGLVGQSPVALAFPQGLPAIPLGELQGVIRFEKGQGTVDTLQLRSDQVELQATGTLRLKPRLQYTEPALDVKLRVEPELVQTLGVAGAGLSFLPPDKEDPKFRAARLSGSLGKLSFLPKR
ncbi:type II secretion system protein GspN [Stigmatella erecta]|uniref:Type II secretion system protein N n=1 Tax=Stigmatella erecta TaxID=83460 RepID=A0A1I0FG57_9BACT|nr:type II secretion system protein GspN [Stigmatella erecta]SET57192.1 type II secretion system protein N [Stigmatella erecta]